MAERFDVIIIGSCAGGCTPAHTLAPSGIVVTRRTPEPTSLHPRPAEHAHAHPM